MQGLPARRNKACLREALFLIFVMTQRRNNRAQAWRALPLVALQVLVQRHQLLQRSLRASLHSELAPSDSPRI